MTEPSQLFEHTTYQRITNVLSHKYYIFFVAVLCVFIDNLIYTIIIPVLPLYQKTYSVSQTWIGVFTAACPAAVCICAPGVGWAVDKVGPKKTMVCGSIALGVGTVVYALAQSFWVLLLSRILQGAAAGVTWTSGMSLIPMIVSREEQGKYTGNLMVGSGIGALAGPVISGALIDWGGVSAPFIMSIILVVLQNIAVLAMIINESSDKENKEGILTLLKDLGIVGISLANFSSGFMWALIEPILAIYLASKFGMSTFWIGMSIGGMMLSFTAGAPLVGWLTDSKFPERRAETIIASVAIQAIIYPIFPLVQTGWMAVVTLVVAGFFSSGGTVASPMINTIVEARYNGKLYGAGSAIATFVWNLGSILGPLLGSIFAENFGIQATFIGQFFFITIFVILPFVVILVRTREMISPTLEKKQVGNEETDKILPENEHEILLEEEESL